MKKKFKLKNILIHLIIISIILSLVLIKYYTTKIEPSITKYAESETKRIITLIINNSIHDYTKNNIKQENIFTVDNNNNISTINLNTEELNKITDSINIIIGKNIKLVEDGKIDKLNLDLKGVSEIEYEQIKGGVIYYIPIGNINNSFLTNNIYPQIPIKFSMSGDVISKITSSIKEYGINNALIEIKVNVKVSLLINMPFVTKETTVSTSIPIIMKIIQGNIPEYYPGIIKNS